MKVKSEQVLFARISAQWNSTAPSETVVDFTTVESLRRAKVVAKCISFNILHLTEAIHLSINEIRENLIDFFAHILCNVRYCT